MNNTLFVQTVDKVNSVAATKMHLHSTWVSPSAHAIVLQHNCRIPR